MVHRATPRCDGATIRPGSESNVKRLTELRYSLTMRPSTLFPFGVLFAIWGAALLAQVPATQDSSPAPNASQPQRVPQSTGNASPESTAPTEEARRALLERVIANQKNDDLEQYTYERLERLEVTKGPTARKIAKKQKERSDLIDATRAAFLYTFIAREKRGDRILEKYQLAPNPVYHATSRATSMFAKVRGYVWIDEEAAQVARAEMEVTEDISIGGFLAKVYKGSHFMQERYEMAPGLWFATYSQYDFDGRRLFVSFGLHERTAYSRYRRIGPPREALQAIRAELGKTDSAKADP